MTSACTIRAKSTGSTTDPATGAVVATPGALVYSGKCRLRPAGRTANVADAGGGEVFTFDYQVAIPFSAVGVRAGHRVTIDASPDPDAVGLELEVQPSRFAGEHITARRLACSEVS